jgi:hypothetical protein
MRFGLTTQLRWPGDEREPLMTLADIAEKLGMPWREVFEVERRVIRRYMLGTES